MLTLPAAIVISVFVYASNNLLMQWCNHKNYLEILSKQGK